MKRLHKLIVTSAALASLLSIGAIAQEPMGANMNGSKCAFQKNCNNQANRGYHAMGMKRNPIISTLRYLDLTQEQTKALKELRVSHQKEMRELRKVKRMEGLRMQTLIDALSKDGVDKEKLLDEATKQFQARETKQLEHLSQVLAILTPEQRMELKKLLQNKMKNRPVRN
jgi:Spy/CpxP family protein refolding chaperone